MEFQIPQIVKDHPYIAGISVFAVGMLVLYELGYFSPAAASGGGGDPTMGAYYQAVAASQVSGNALAIAQEQGTTAVNLENSRNNAASAIARIMADRDVSLGGQAKDVSLGLATTAANRDTDIAKLADDVNLQNVNLSRDVNLAGIAAAERMNYEGVHVAYDTSKLAADTATTIAAGREATTHYVAGLAADTERARIVGATIEQGNLVNSVTQSYQTIGNYQYTDYLKNLAALSPTGAPGLVQPWGGTGAGGIGIENLPKNNPPVSAPAGAVFDYFTTMFPHGVGTG